MIRFFLIASVLFLPEAVLADSGFMDGLANVFKESTSGWAGPALNIATYIFWTLAAIEFAWAAAMWAMDKDNMSSFMAAMTKKILVIGFFYTLVMYGATWIPAIIESLKGSAAIIANVPSTISPSTVIDQGLSIVSTMWRALVDQMGITNLGSSLPVAFICVFATIIVILSFILIAAQYLIALIESYIVLGAGILFLGFGGSSWTRDFTQKYIGYAVASGVKLMMILILIGIGTSVSANWTAQLAGALSGGDLKDLLDSIFSITGGAVLFAVLAWQIPSLASSMLSGSPSLTAGSAAGTALGGAALTAGAAMGAGAMVSGALAQAGGMARAVGAAADLTKAQAISGTGAGSTLAGMGIAGSGLATAVNLVSGLGGQAGRGVSSIIGATTDASKGTFGGRAAAGLSARSAQINEQSSAMGNGGGSSGAGMAQGSGAASGGAAAPGGVDAKPSPSTRDELNEASKTGAIHELPAVGAGGSAQPDSPQSSESNASQEARKKPGFRRVQPPQLPPDHAPPATVNINLNTSPD